MVEPGDETGAGASGDGALPAARAGLDRVIATLETAFVQGRLTKDEFELRIGQALAIYAELDALTADIPAAASAVVPPAEAARQAANKKMIQQGTVGVAGVTFLLDAVLVIPRNPLLGVVAGILLTCFVTVLAAGFLTLLSWAMDRRAGSQSASGSPPGTGREAPRRPRAADQPDSLPGGGQDPPHATQATRRRLRPRRLATTHA
jgi:Domain of unknown function (DUF1707)